jgi:anaerobic selenocysteine-containing dehydrogenase
MVNEAGRFPEVCKKSIQAQAGDMGAVFDEARFSKLTFHSLEVMSSYELERLGRITVPMLARRGARTFERISWDDALTLASTRFRETAPNRAFVYASGRSSNEAAFLLQLVARAYGTPHINNCSYYCHSASGVALSQVYGSGTSSLVLEDLSRADLAIVAGANPASNHPRLVSQLVHLKRRGGRVIVINPLRELGMTRFRIPSDVRSFLFGSDVSDLYLQPHVGGDIPLLRGLLKGVVETGGVDTEFVTRHTEDWERVRTDVDQDPWENLIGLSGVDREGMDRAIRMIVQAKRGIAL